MDARDTGTIRPDMPLPRPSLRRFRGLLAARGNMPRLLAFVPQKKDTPEEVSCCAEEDGLRKTFDGELASDSQEKRSKVWEILLRALLDTSLAIVSYLL